MVDLQMKAELKNLWHAGAVYLPDVSSRYANATKDLSLAVDQESKLFHMLGDSRKSPAADTWNLLCERFHGIVYESGENIRDVGDALVDIAWGYEDCDDATRADLEATIADEFTSDIEQQTPPGEFDDVVADGEVQDYRSSDHTSEPEKSGLEPESDAPQPEA